MFFLLLFTLSLQHALFETSFPATSTICKQKFSFTRNSVPLQVFLALKYLYFLGFMQVTSPAGNAVHTLKGTSGDKFEFKAPRSGMYKFCFHNPHSTPETVSFYIHVGHIPNEHDLAKDGLSNSFIHHYIHCKVTCHIHHFHGA